MLRVLPPTKQTLQPYLLQDRFVGSKTRSITQSTRFAALCCKTSCTFFFALFTELFLHMKHCLQFLLGRLKYTGEIKQSFCKV